MEIGLKTTQNKRPPAEEMTALSIHINSLWIAFVFYNKKKRLIDQRSFAKPKSNTQLTKSIKKIFKKYKNLKLLNSIFLVYYNTKSTLVPSVLFNKKNLIDYVKYNSEVSGDNLFSYDDVLNKSIKNAYVSSSEINNYIFKKFGSFEHFHYTTLLINEFEKHVNSDFNFNFFLNIVDKKLDLICFEKSSFIFYNSFDFSNDEDVLFYALFCFKQLKIDPEKVFMSCSGVINLKSSLYFLLYKYVRNIKIIDPHEDESNNILFSVKR